MSADEMISVVVTCYNLERFIEEAVRSALDQRDGGPFEVIVVDDCSEDTSREILACIPGISVVEMERNSGVMLATIAGTQAAKGDVVCYLDGDDIWAPDKISAVREAFRDPALALMSHDLVYADRRGTPLERVTRPSQVFRAGSESAWPELLRTGILSIGDYVWLGSALSIRRSTAQWDEFSAWVKQMADPRNIYQDWPLAYWIASREEAALAYHPGKLMRYRLHGANHSGDTSTPERAVRNYRRSSLTMSEIHALAIQRSAARNFRSASALRAALFEACAMAFAGQRLSALRSLPGILPRLVTQRAELPTALKLAIVIVLGPGLTTRLRSLFASGRATPKRPVRRRR